MNSDCLFIARRKDSVQTSQVDEIRHLMKKEGENIFPWAIAETIGGLEEKASSFSAASMQLRGCVVIAFLILHLVIFYLHF